MVREDWQGNRSPYKNPMARGCIAGLSLAHGPGHVVRGIYEATACGTRHILRTLRPMAYESNAFSWEEEELDRRSGCKSTPISSKNRFTCREKRNHAHSARPWRPRLPQAYIATSDEAAERHGYDRDTD